MRVNTEKVDGKIRVEYEKEENEPGIAWSPVREDLGLNFAGPEKVEGLELVEEKYAKRTEYMKVYKKIVLTFEDKESMKKARRRLENKARERFEWGMDSEARDVRDFPIPRAGD